MCFLNNILRSVFLYVFFPSLTVEVLRTKGPCVVEENDPIFERGSTTTYSSFRKSFYTKPWSNKGEYVFGFKFWVCRRVLVFTYAFILGSFHPQWVNGSTSVSSHVISTLHTYNRQKCGIYCENWHFSKIQCLLIYRLFVLFFHHGCLDAEEVLVCFIKSIILDSGLQIFEFYMVLKLGSSGMGRNRLWKVSLCGLISM